MAVYSLYLTNIYGFKLKFKSTNAEKKQLRLDYANQLLSRLNIEIVTSGIENIQPHQQYLLLANHRSVIDPCIVEIALKDTDILGLWVSKKELYNSFFFGMFVRNAGAILIDRSSSKMGRFFSDIKDGLKTGASICIFPEGTRNQENEDIAEFKKGTQLIAVKNRLPILPVHIRTNSHRTLSSAIKRREKHLQIEIEFGDVIDYKDRSMDLEQRYRTMFAADRMAS